MKKIIRISFVLCALAIAVGSVTAGTTITVNGTACPYFASETVAGLPTTGRIPAWLDNVAATLPPSMDITGMGGLISVSATGTWGHGPGLLSGPDGYVNAGFPGVESEYMDFGISTVEGANLNTLVGVFLTDSGSDGIAPANLISGSDMTTPLLQQMFVVGSSLENIVVPDSATQLYFGLFNGYEWSNNVGSLEVTVCPAVPAPGAFLLGGIGVTLVGWIKRRRAL